MGTPAPGSPVPLLPELARSPGHVVWRAAARVQLALEESLPKGVDIHAYAVLLALADGAPRSQTWLAETVSVSKTTMTRVAKELTARGDVERVRNPRDQRSFLLSRTAQGAATATAWRHHAASVEVALSGGFSAAERTRLRTLLQQVVEPHLADEAPAELRGSTGFLISQLHLRMHTEGMETMRDLGFEPRFMGTLIVLRELGAISQAELARHLGISEPSAMQIAETMELKGLVVRYRSAVDRRHYDLMTTEHADVVAPDARARLHAVADRHLAPLTAAERTELRGLLVRLVNGD